MGERVIDLVNDCIHVFAIQTSALLEVTVADVNDEVPIFVTNEYQTSLKEGALAFSHPVTLHVSSFILCFVQL